ncbi:hypothetical protein EMPS_01547 [Entomortierella parvispora]|uniref:Uncharacterized protein n=1 Tax=Entomortierella parvispora TaxID=205924 RepID=A0A9P3H319_9FUNG|nr:hypothetical protein EMPS_01547 [Entomortierella parvispora]
MSHSTHLTSPPKTFVEETKDTAQTSTTSRPLLTLPAPEDVAKDGHQLEVNGKDVKLDALGPVGKISLFGMKVIYAAFSANLYTFNAPYSGQRRRHNVQNQQLGRNG